MSPNDHLPWWEQALAVVLAVPLVLYVGTAYVVNRLSGRARPLKWL